MVDLKFKFVVSPFHLIYISKLLFLLFTWVILLWIGSAQNAHVLSYRLLHGSCIMEAVYSLVDSSTGEFRGWVCRWKVRGGQSRKITWGVIRKDASLIDTHFALCFLNTMTRENVFFHRSSYHNVSAVECISH